MTFLLVFGSLALLGTIYKKSRGNIAKLPGEISLGEPYGSYIKSVIEKDGHLYISVDGGGEADRIIIFDTASGQKISRISIN